MAVAQFVLDRRQGELTAGYAIPVESPLETDTIEGEPCRFRTCYPVTLWPFELVSAELKGQPFSAPAVSLFLESRRPCCGWFFAVSPRP